MIGPELDHEITISPTSTVKDVQFIIDQVLGDYKGIVELRGNLAYLILEASVRKYSKSADVTKLSNLLLPYVHVSGAIDAVMDMYSV